MASNPSPYPSGGGGGITPPAGDIGGTSAAPTVTSTHLAAPLPQSQGGTGTAGPVGTLAATTGLAGVALVNGTQTILTVTTPNDGAMHYVTFILSLQVTVLEVGGMITTGYTDPQGNAHTFTAIAGAQGVGLQPVQVQRLVAPNTTVNILQGTALTSGSSVLNADIWIA